MSLSESTERNNTTEILTPKQMGWRVNLQILMVLFKSRVVSLLLLAATGGAFLAAGGWPGLPTMILVIVSGGLTASGSAGLNQYLEQSSDALMGRTRRRPLVTGDLQPRWVLWVSLLMVIVPPLLLTPFNLALAFYLFAGAFIYVVLYTRQAQAREQAQSLLVELEAANRQLADYAAQVEDLTIASERQRMARQLHDTLSQGLAGVILQLEAADAHLTMGRPERAQGILQQTMGQARATLSDARRAIGDLRQVQNGPEDLVEALRDEVDHFTRATGIPCELEIDLAEAVPPALGETVLRSVSESLSNIARHANAHRACLRLSSLDGQLLVEVRDDGGGFDPLAVQAGHYGLLGMRERARLVGGSMEIDSAPGAGTVITLHLPLSLEVEAGSRG